MRFDEGFLREMGLSVMNDEEKDAFLKYVQEELEVRIGEEIANGISEEKIDEFEQMQSREEIGAWLTENRPDYREIVERTINELKEEIRKNKEKILQK